LEDPLRLTVLAVLSVLWPVVSRAADDIKPFDAKPGLWESTVTTEISGMPAMQAMPQIPESALAKMTSEQRARVEAMMKARSGGGAPQMTNKVCLTRESLQSGALGRRDKSCTSKVVSASSSSQMIHVECIQGEMKSTGDLSIELIDREHMKGTMLMKSSAGEQARDMKVSFNNKWIAADCGDVKPAVPK
jgi:hypothetical protein